MFCLLWIHITICGVSVFRIVVLLELKQWIGEVMAVKLAHDFPIFFSWVVVLGPVLCCLAISVCCSGMLADDADSIAMVSHVCRFFLDLLDRWCRCGTVTKPD
eukprot:374100_1